MINMFHSIFEVSLYGSLVIAATALISRFTQKRYSSKWQYFIWMILAIRMVLPLHLHWIEIPLSVPVQQVQTRTEFWDSAAKGKMAKTETAAVKPMTGSGTTASQPLHQSELVEKTPQPEQPHMSILFLFSCIWLAGALLFLTLNGLTYIAFLFKIRRWQMPVTNKTAVETLAMISSELHIKKTIPLITCKYISSPMMVGFLHPRIVLPVQDFQKEQLEVILKHELIHLKHHDLYYKLLVLTANAIHWFNPLVYYMVNASNYSMERFCDETVVEKQSVEYRELYSMTILQVLKSATTENSIAFSTNFNGGKQQMKNRFYQIMNTGSHKRGVLIFTILLCLILMTGSLVIIQTKETKTAKAETNEAKEIKEERNILLIGIDSSPTRNFADSFLMVTLQPEKKKITLTSFLRDLYVSIPGHGKNKLSHVSHLGGNDLIKKTIESNFDLKIDGTICVNFEAFEKIVNLLGGVEITLTAKEAKYLKTTNYISNPSYRTVKEGNNNLNGNQALGYARIRYVVAANGERDDLGRTYRQRALLESIYNKKKNITNTDWVKIAKTALLYVTTDMDAKEFISCLSVATDHDFTTKTQRIPFEGTYEQRRIDNMMVLYPDLDAIKKQLN